MTLHFISGLGADERIFDFIQLPGIHKRMIQWISPLKNESMKSYAERLIVQIDRTDPVCLLGVSFGGMIAQEISQIIPCKKVILVSSVRSEKGFSLPLRIVRKTGLYKLFPIQLLKWGSQLVGNYFFGTKNKKQSDLLFQMIDYTDDDFMRWSIDCIMQWKPPETPVAITHLHGTNDRIFPFKLTKKAIPIKNGGHFMIVNDAIEVSKVLQHVLKPMDKTAC